MSLFTESLREVYRPKAASWVDQESPLNPLHIFFGYRSRYKRMPYVDIILYLFCLTWLIRPVVNLLKALTLLPVTMAKNYFRDKKDELEHSSTLAGKLGYAVCGLARLTFSLLTTALSMVLTPSVFAEKLLHFLKRKKGNELSNIFIPGFFLGLSASVIMTALSNHSVYLFFIPILGHVGWLLGILWTVFAIVGNATLLPMSRIFSGQNEQTLTFSNSNESPADAMRQVKTVLARVGGNNPNLALAQLKEYLEHKTPGLSFKEVTLREFISSQFSSGERAEELKKILESFVQRYYPSSSSTKWVVGQLGTGGPHSVDYRPTMSLQQQLLNQQLDEGHRAEGEIDIDSPINTPHDQEFVGKELRL